MTDITDTINRLSAKVDLLIDSLPQRYVPRTDYDPWRNNVETRLRGLEESQSNIKDNISRRNEDGTRFALQTIKDIDLKIDQRHQSVLDKLEAVETKQDDAQRLAHDQHISRSSLVISIVFGGVATIIAVTNFLAIHWRW